MFKLADTDWDKELEALAASGTDELLIISPFIKLQSVERLLRHGTRRIRVITRFDLNGFCDGVSDITALRRLMAIGAPVRGVQHLHAKVYLTSERGIVTSANLTEAALTRNHEFGVVAEDGEFIAACRRFFEGMWERAVPNLTLGKLSKWENEVLSSKRYAQPLLSRPRLRDYGANLGLLPSPPLGVMPTPEPSQWFVKFLGEGHRRVPFSFPVLSEVKRAGCHWACGYPKGKRPRQVKTGDIVLLGRLVANPSDIMIFGRGIGKEHEDKKDDATEAEKRFPQRSWKRKWPHYVRLSKVEFINGIMADGVSLREMERELGARAYFTTQRNAAKRSGNLNPRRAYSQQPAVRLTRDGYEWLSSRLDVAFATHGRISARTMDELDWPIR